MKRTASLFFRAVIVMIAVAALIILIRFPLTEGRAEHLDLVSIYADPFILYGYAVSVVFFVGLYKAFRLVGYMRLEETDPAVLLKTVRSIRYCAILLCVLIVAAGIYIRLFHNADDDPAGFLAICMVMTLAFAAVAVAAARFEKRGIANP